MPTLPHCGVYRITCLPTGKVYIGSSQDIDLRWRHHRNALHGNRHDNSTLQADWTTYGEDLFLFEIIEITPPETRQEREAYWMDRLQSLDAAHGYNQHTGRSPLIMLPPTRANMAKAARARGIDSATRAKMVASRHASGGYTPSPKLREAARVRSSKAYVCIAPDGQHYAVVNLTEFCHTHDLGYHSMLRVIRGDRSHHKGWRCQRVGSNS